jgi:hypothetical protein
MQAAADGRAFRRAITAVEIMEKREDFDRCLFTYEDSLKENPEGQ